MSLFPDCMHRDTLRALQLCYYVDVNPLLSDYAFDMTEAEYEKQTGDVLPVGGDSLAAYTPAQRALALYLQISHSKQGKLDAERDKIPVDKSP